MKHTASLSNSRSSSGVGLMVIVVVDLHMKLEDCLSECKSGSGGVDWKPSTYGKKAGCPQRLGNRKEGCSS